MPRDAASGPVRFQERTAGRRQSGCFASCAPKAGYGSWFLAARTDPLDEQASLLRAQLERLGWETLLPWLLHVVEEAFGVADVTYTERDVQYELAF